jgi:hypothetical protein
VNYQYREEHKTDIRDLPGRILVPLEVSNGGRSSPSRGPMGAEWAPLLGRLGARWAP